MKELEHLLAAYAIDAQDLLINFRLLWGFAGLDLDEEAMRIDRDLRAYALLAVGRIEEAERSLRLLAAADPASVELRTALADALYLQRRYEEAVDVWRTTLIDTAQGRVVYSNGGSAPSLRLAHALAEVGEGEEARELIATLKRVFAEYSEAVGRGAGWYFDRAVLAILDGETGAVPGLWERAIEKGWFYLDAFDEPVFDAVRSDAAFARARAAIERKHGDYRAQVISYICDRNPVPDYWRPLDDTCSERGIVTP